jgi:DNA-binding response OmpR family regulator
LEQRTGARRERHNPTETEDQMTDRTRLLVACADERRLGFLCDQLAADGYEPRRARTSEEVRVKSRHEAPVALLLGELQERSEALQLLQSIRAGGPADAHFDPGLPVIVMSADPGQLALLRAFDAGCDDFVAGDCAYIEVRARLRALLRRCSLRRGGIRRIGALLIDPHERCARYEGRRLALSRIEFALLHHLAVDPTRVATKQELLREVWGYRLPGRTRTVDAHACRLRKRLAAAGAPGLVVNSRGVGYRLLDGVESASTERRVLRPAA